MRGSNSPETQNQLLKTVCLRAYKKQIRRLLLLSTVGAVTLLSLIYVYDSTVVTDR